MRSVHKQRVAREATGGHRLRIRRTGGESAGKACSRSSAGRITSLSHLPLAFASRTFKEKIGRAKGSGVRAQLLRLRKVASANHRKRRQPASSQGISRAAELKPLSHAFSGAVPGTHPAACKRPHLYSEQAPEGRGETTKPGATTEPAVRRKNICVPR